MNISCKIIRDLLPLYHDNVCSDDSRALVDEHLKTCKECSDELRRMDESIGVEPKEADKETVMRAISSAWKKVKKKSFTKGIILTALICALLAGAFWGMTSWKVIPVPADALEVTELSELSDGAIVFRLFVNDNKNLYFIKFTATDDGSFYLTPMHSIIETARKYDMGAFDKYHIFYPSGYEGEGEKQGIVLPDNIKRIYVGPVGKGTLVWEEDMELPEASEIIDKMVS